MNQRIPAIEKTTVITVFSLIYIHKCISQDYITIWQLSYTMWLISSFLLVSVYNKVEAVEFSFPAANWLYDLEQVI